MTTRRTVQLACLLVLGVLPAACSDEPLTSSPSNRDVNLAADLPRQIAPPHSIDAFFVDVARTVPGFGGLFFEEGQPTIYLFDRGASEAVRQVLAPMLAARGFGSTPFRVLDGQYDWLQLAEWNHRQILPVLAMDGVIFTDADYDAIDRLVGVSGEHTGPGVDRPELGVGAPAGAEAAEVTERPAAVQS